MQKGTTVFIKLRMTLAPAMRQILEHVGPLRYVGVKMMSWYLKPTVQWDGHTVSVDPVDFGVSFELESTGEYEAASMAYCKSVLKPGMTFVDVGANIGLFSLMAARQVGPTGKVYAFEPGADNCTLLRKNIEQNGYRNVTIVEKAVSDKTGTCTLYQSGFNTADHRIYHVSNSRKQVTIGCVALDDYFPTGTTVDMIKMDIEGAEESGIRGMKRILNENQGVKFIVECWPAILRKVGTDPIQLFQSLEQTGFVFSFIDDATGAITRMANAEMAVMMCVQHKMANILCIRE